LSIKITNYTDQIKVNPRPVKNLESKKAKKKISIIIIIIVIIIIIIIIIIIMLREILLPD
jgi:uncharacterized integral membrane protein